MTINERMNHIIKELYGGNKRAFANAIGVSATVIENGVNGILIPVGDEKAMTENINRLIEDEELREGLAGEALHIRERINGQAILQQWKEYIEKVLK